jgi:hypothetical protein
VVLNAVLHHRQKIVLQFGQGMDVQPPWCSNANSHLQQRSGWKMAASVELTWSDEAMLALVSCTAARTAARTSGSATAFTYLANPSFVNLLAPVCMSRGVVIKSAKHSGQRTMQPLRMKNGKESPEKHDST